MENNSHAMLGPSSSHRWLECPPSAKLQENYPNESSSYAELGTQAHALCEYKLNKMLGKVEDEPVLELRDAEMDDCSDGYVAYISEIITSLKDSDSSPIVLVEQRLDFSKYVQDGFGTGDCVIVGNGVLHVVDYKNGTGVEVSAVENPQMMIYALGALDLFDCLYDIEKIVMTIYQPRLSNISTFEMKKADLLEWANNVLVPKAKLAYEGKGEFKAGEHCRFCKCKAQCRTLAKMNMGLATYDFKEPALLTDEEITEILTKVDGLVEWASSIKDFALAEAIKGKKWDGFKVVEGKSNRKYTDEEKVALTVIEAGFDPYDKKVVGITELQKRLGKTKFNELLKDLIVKPQGKPSLAPMSDKRQEFNLAKQDFMSTEDNENDNK